MLLGRNFVTQLLRSIESPDACVAMICAHEFAHILQFKRRLHERLIHGQHSVKRLELQADFLAGYFAGIRKLERPSFPAAVFATTALQFGDNFVNHYSHHGTPTERASSVVLGFQSAFTERKGLEETIVASIRYVEAI